MFTCQNAYSQVRSSGNIFISKKTEAAIHAMPLRMTNSKSGSLPGIIGTERSAQKGYLSFNVSGLIIGGSDSAHIDGYAKSYITGAHLLPIGDNGIYRPVQLRASKIRPADAAYFKSNPSLAVTSSIKGGNEPVLPVGGPFSVLSKDNLNVETIDSTGYWDINGNESTPVSLSWNVENQLTPLLNSDLFNLIVVGWNGTQWVKINASIDPISLLGVPSTLTKGSITTTEIVPNSYEVYALAKRSLPKDTLVTPIDTSVIAVGPRFTPDSNVKFVLRGPFYGAGSATVDNSGLVLFTPNPLAPIGIDTIYKIRIYSIGGILYSDTFRIYIRTPLQLADTSIVIAMNTSALTVNQSPTVLPGNTLSFSFYGAKYGSYTQLNNQGSISYKPNLNFIGVDTIYRISQISYTNGSILFDTSRIVIFITPQVSDTLLMAKSDSTIFIGPRLTLGPNSFLISSSSNASAKRGNAVLNSDGSISYTPFAESTGIDTITRILCVSINGQVFCDTSYVFIGLNNIVKVPNFISPNGDGKNDVWVLPSYLYREHPDLKVIIYNRWGNIVWRSKGVYQNNWAGVNIDDELVPDGVYYYLIELNSNGEKSIAGFIEVMRN
jgi:gliding motility-associated-like protein